MKITAILKDPLTGNMFTSVKDLKDPAIAWGDGNKFEDMFISGKDSSGAYVFIPLACVTKIGTVKVEHWED